MYFTYLFFNKITDYKSTTFVFLAIIYVPLLYGIYRTLKKQYQGATIESQMEDISKLIPRKPTTLFILLLPMLFPIFAIIYSLPLTFLISLVLTPSGTTEEVHKISYFVLITSLILSIVTIIWIWKRIKRNMITSIK